MTPYQVLRLLNQFRLRRAVVPEFVPLFVEGVVIVRRGLSRRLDRVFPVIHGEHRLCAGGFLFQCVLNLPRAEYPTDRRDDFIGAHRLTLGGQDFRNLGFRLGLQRFRSPRFVKFPDLALGDCQLTFERLKMSFEWFATLRPLESQSARG